MSKVIACLDGSAATKTVSRYAAWCSQKMSVPLELLHVLDHKPVPVVTDLSGNIGLGSQESLLLALTQLDEQRNRLALEHGKNMLDEMQADLHSQLNLQAHTVQRHGHFLETVLELACNSRLLVLGRQGLESQNEAMHIGSHIENVVRALHQPVLMTAGEFIEPQSFLLAFDGSNTARNCVEMVAASPLLQGLSCHLLMVGQPIETHQAALDWAVALLSRAGFAVTFRILMGEVETTLLQYQQQQGIDWMVIGAYGHSRIRQFFIGSTTTQILKQAVKPVLLLR